MTPELKQLLNRQRSLRRAAAIRRWWVIGLFVLALPLGVFALADSWEPLEKSWRWIALGVFLLAILLTLVRWRLASRPPAEHDMASELDGLTSLSGGYAISTSAELDKPRTGLPEESLLLARLHAEAGKLAAAAPVHHPGPRLWQTLGAALGVMLVAGLLGYQGMKPVERMLMPWSDLHYTTLTLTGPEKKPLARQAFTVTGRVTGRIPATLTLQAANGPAIKVPVAADGTYRHVFENGVNTPVVLVSRGGADGVSPPLKIDLRDIPRVAEYAHRITPPSYTRQPERIETHGSFTMLRASLITYGVVLDRPAAGLRIAFDNDLGTLPLAPDPGRPMAWGLKLPPVARTCGYRLEVAEADGVFHPMGELQQIVVAPDKPPVVDVLTHNGAKLKSPKDVFTMKFRASDDVGLENISILYRRVGDKDQKSNGIRLNERGIRSQDGSWELPLASLNAHPHDMIAVVVQAQDGNRMDGPGIGNSEPILFEIPEEKADADSQAGGGGGGGQPAQQVNPLEIEQELYRQTLRLSLGRKAPSKEELQQRQQENAANLAEMAADPEQAAMGAEYLGLLESARQSAVEAANELKAPAGQSRAPLERSLAAEANVIDSLLKAARLAEQNPPPPSEAQQSQQGQPGKQFSLTKPNSATQQPQSDEEKKEQIEQAVADLKQAIEKQDQINKEIAQQAEGQKPQEGKPEDAKSQEGKPQDGQQADGKPQDGQQSGQQTAANPASQGKPQDGKPGQQSGQQPGQQPGQQSGSQGASALAQQQSQARQTSDQIRAQLQGLGKSENGADPALAAEQLKQASEFQGQAAAAIAGGDGSAGQSGRASADALRKAEQLTESLLGETANGGADGRSQALEYQHLIQEYTRRLSYDD